MGGNSLSLGSNGAASAAIAVNGAAGTVRSTRLQTGGLFRWDYGASQAAESGSNAGSDFYFNSFSDDGTYRGTPFTINRATGQTTLTSLSLNGLLILRSYTVATVPAGTVGAEIFVSNARKIGEGASAGTGVIAYFSNGNWRRLSDDSPVAA